MKNQFTPGPWHTGGYSYVGRVATQNVWGPTAPGDQSGELIAKDVWVQNARLIAAAPDLLDACKRFEPVLAWLEGHNEDTAGFSLAKQLRPIMQAAIQKAEGSQ